MLTAPCAARETGMEGSHCSQGHLGSSDQAGVGPVPSVPSPSHGKDWCYPLGRPCRGNSGAGGEQVAASPALTRRSSALCFFPQVH